MFGKIKKVDPLPNLYQLISLLFVITPRFILAKFHFYLSSHYYYIDSRNLYFRFILLFREYLVLFESVNAFIFSIQRTCTYLTLLALLPFIPFIIIMIRFAGYYCFRVSHLISCYGFAPGQSCRSLYPEQQQHPVNSLKI